MWVLQDIVTQYYNRISISSLRGNYSDRYLLCRCEKE